MTRLPPTPRPGGRVAAALETPALGAVLGEDRCDTSHPDDPEIRCSLPVGHGGDHRCSTREGEGYEWR
ncbi:MAG: hypothetical protein ACSLE3_04065 [Microbacteriaceae bacterium]